MATTTQTTALAVIEPSYTPAEMRAWSILSQMDCLTVKLKTLEDDIRALWLDFDNLKAGETILGCATKKEFCEKKLNRTPRSIQYMLAGQSNPADRPHRDRSELSSPANSDFENLPKPTTCPDCQQSFLSRNQLRNHGKTQHGISSSDIATFLRRAVGKPMLPVVTETHWISEENSCPTGKRSFDYPDDIWQLMRAEGTIGPKDFIAYIHTCGQCGKCHRDKDQSGHKEGDFTNARHQTWYRPDELNRPESASEDTTDAVQPQPQPTHTAFSSKTAQLRDWFNQKYPAFKLKPAEKDLRGVGGRMGRYDLTVFNLTPAQVKAIGEILQ